MATSIVTLADVKTYLRYPSPTQPASDDAPLQWFIDAATEVVQFECDDILPHSYSEYYDGGDTNIFTRHRPILSIENVEEGWGFLSYELNYVQVNSPAADFSMFAYSIDNPETGEVSRRTAGNVPIPFRAGDGNIFIQYTTGEQKVPAAVKLATLQLISHWWKNSQFRAMAVAGTNIAYDAVEGALYSRDTESGTQNINIGVPYAILEMLKSHRHGPFFA